MKTTKIEAAIRAELKTAQRAQETERRTGTPDSYEAVTARVAEYLDVLRADYGYAR